MIRRLLSNTAVACFMCWALLANNASATYQVGKDYDILPSPIMTQTGDKIEVLEIFWYGCSHCYRFEQYLAKWKTTLAKDVAFVMMPADWGGAMGIHARAFYTAEALAVIDTLHPIIFKAIHEQKQRLHTEKSIKQLFVSHGVSAQDFDGIFTSFGVDAQVSLAKKRMNDYHSLSIISNPNI